MTQAMKWKSATHGALRNADLIGAVRWRENSAIPLTNISLLFFHTINVSR
jgi:hypothetical protein|tara:strand:+ start:645 stop:794 length:150 start_codon:yes stop_codon:yes gene_type:complete